MPTVYFPTCMASYEIAVYITSELYQYGQNNYGDGYRARERAKTYIQGAMDRHGHTADFVSTDGYHPNVITQKYDTSFTTTCPCDPRYNCSYNNLLDWFKAWIECDGKPSGADSNIILSKTNSSSGGVAYGSGGSKYAHATTGKFVCDLPSSYENYGWSDSHDGMNTILHEIGHNLMQGSGVDGSDPDDAGHHDVAALKSRIDWYTITAMKIKGGENECGDTYSQGYEGWENTWSDCCESFWD